MPDNQIKGIQDVLDKIQKHKPETRPIVYILLVLSLLLNSVLIAEKMQLIPKIPHFEIKLIPVKEKKS